MAKVILASASPRRRELMICLGLPFEEVQPEVDELHAMAGGGSALEKAALAALAKARCVSSVPPGAAVVGADTIVVLGGRILGKPGSAGDARQMLRDLRGREHKVITGLAIIAGNPPVARTCATTSQVLMRPFSSEDVEDYVRSGDCFDKAGAYGIQSEKFRPVAGVRGCYLNVVGLPVCDLELLAKSAGFEAPVGLAQRLPAVCKACSVADTG